MKSPREGEIKREDHEIGREKMLNRWSFVSSFLSQCHHLAWKKGDASRRWKWSSAESPPPPSHSKHQHVVHWRELPVSFLVTKCSPGSFLLITHRRGFYDRNLIHFTGEKKCNVVVYTDRHHHCVSEALSEKPHRRKGLREFVLP